MFGELKNRFFSEANISSSDDDDFPSEVRDISICIEAYNIWGTHFLRCFLLWEAREGFGNEESRAQRVDDKMMVQEFEFRK